MQITIYLDVIFFINFIVDFAVLYITGIVAGKKVNMLKVAMGATLGAGLLLVFTLHPTIFTGWKGIAITVGISMGAVAIPYGDKISSLVRTWFLSTTIMILTGGIMNYLKYIFHISILQMLQWLLLFGASSVGILICIYSIKKSIKQSDNIYLIQIRHGNADVIESVYMDTGNLLKDPIFHKPVIVLSENVVCKCLKEEEKQIVRQYKESGKIDYRSLLTCQTQKKVYFHEIAFRSVGNPSGKLLCILVDEISILGEKKVLYRQPIAIVPEALFAGKMYQGLLHKECI